MFSSKLSMLFYIVQKPFTRRRCASHRRKRIQHQSGMHLHTKLEIIHSACLGVRFRRHGWTYPVNLPLSAYSASALALEDVNRDTLKCPTSSRAKDYWMQRSIRESLQHKKIGVDRGLPLHSYTPNVHCLSQTQGTRSVINQYPEGTRQVR